MQCSFCGKRKDQVARLIAGGHRKGTFICNECLGVAAEIEEDHAEPLGPRTTVGVRELRNQVAAVVRRAAAGERIVVTVDGRPTAQLGPLDAAGPRLTLDDLAASGLLEPPHRQSAPPPPAEDLAVDVRLDRIVEELRGR